MSGEKQQKTEAVSDYLAKQEVHDQWEDAYRSPLNERFYEHAFDLLARELNAPAGATILDVGCGPGFHSIRLAKRGLNVDACDFSPPILELARENVRKAGVEDKVGLSSENILALTFNDDSREFVLCWGVLMHIPDIEQAIAELSRVLAPGGTIVISENNTRALQSRSDRLLKKLLRRQTAEITPAGAEHWSRRESGTLLTREANINWLVAEFARHGVRLDRRLPTQFTEAYTKAPNKLIERAIHRFNGFWFDYVKSAGPAEGNLLFLSKRA